MELFKIICVVTPRNPDLQVAFWPVLLIEVLNCTLIMSGSVEMRIIVKPILDGAANYCLRFDEAIRLCHYQSVFVTWFIAVGCPVVFNCFTHYLNLFLIEMRFDKLVRFKYLSGVFVMVRSAVDEP